MTNVTDYIMEIPNGVSYDRCDIIETYYKNTITWNDSKFANNKRRLNTKESKERVVMRDQL